MNTENRNPLLILELTDAYIEKCWPSFKSREDVTQRELYRAKADFQAGFQCALDELIKADSPTASGFITIGWVKACNYLAWILGEKLK